MAERIRHLTTFYRPQTFSQVVGQEAICKVLSRAVAVKKIAPAYMFSGTRGVGKTTVARILAKSINCKNYPVKEPCNKCHFCQQISKGISLDIMEIDAASHTGVDNVRKLNEEVGFAPVESRYKVVIIDEAHMLSKSAFNALLKTLEEPPRHAVFILATTEPHRFPATIVSRCQHYIFKRVPEKKLEDHLVSILEKEKVDYQQEAVALLARKGAGSVRDSLSLLSQVLALGSDSLDSDSVREVLGVAGHEMMQQLIQAFLEADNVQVVQLARILLDQGLDLGFFLQELTNIWRNLFLLKQVGEKAVPLLEMSEEEVSDWLAWSKEFSLSQIHCSWQMTLEGQKRVLSSVDPALALELLLLNICNYSKLIPIQDLQPQSQQIKKNFSQGKSRLNSDQQTSDHQSEDSPSLAQDNDILETREEQKDLDSSPKDWTGLVNFLQKRQKSCSLPNFRLVQGVIRENKLEIHCPVFWQERIQNEEKFKCFQNLVNEYFQCPMEIQFFPEQRDNHHQELKKKVMDHPAVQKAIDEFQAKILEIKLNDNH